MKKPKFNYYCLLIFDKFTTTTLIPIGKEIEFLFDDLIKKINGV